MRILYLGLPLGALCLARAGHRPVAVCAGHPDAVGARRLRSRLGAAGTLILGRPNLENPDVRRTLASARPDAILSWFWPRRIPAEVLALPPGGAFGVHPSLLPRWRGPDPYFWAIRSGDAETGVTLHHLEPEYDTGAIVAQRRVAMREDDDAWRLARRLDRPSLALLVECAARLARGEHLAGAAQDEALATSAPAPHDEDLAIDWRMSAAEIARLVRAAAPDPAATAQLGERVVEVVRARVASEPPPAALAIAEAWQTARGTVAVRAEDGGVEILAARDAEDGAPVDPRELLGLSGARASRP